VDHFRNELDGPPAGVPGRERSRMPVRELPQDWPLPTEYLVELGRVFALWGSLESSMNLAISKLAGFSETLDWRALVLTAHSNFQQRVDVVATLCSELQHEYPHLKDYEAVITAIRKVQKKRNIFAHNSLFLNEDSGRVETASMTARGALKTDVRPVHVHELKELNAQIHQTLLDLHHLITQVRYPPIWERGQNQSNY